MTTTRAVASHDGKCGAKTRAGTPCTQRAGWGTDHVGHGRCKLHAGSVPRKHGRYSKIPSTAVREIIAELEYIGFLYKDKIVPLSIIKRKPGFLLEPSSRFARSIDLVAQKILSIQIPSTPKLYEKNEDLNELQKELM